MNNTLEQKELRTRWGCSQSTVRRDLQRYGAKPSTYRGLRPVFALVEIERLETKREKDRKLRFLQMRNKLRALAAERPLSAKSEPLVTMAQLRRERGAK